jgi:hypothetical protein
VQGRQQYWECALYQGSDGILSQFREKIRTSLTYHTTNTSEEKTRLHY